MIHLLALTLLAAAIDLGTRIQMFVDEYLIDRKQNVELKLTEPQRREVVLELNKPWESNTSAYYTVFRDGEKIRLYYRGASSDDGSDGYTCYAESTDGIHFTRPELGIVEFNGSKQNNIIFRGGHSASFAPFRDANPNAKPDEQYKALCYEVIDRHGSMGAMASPDGIHWRRMVEGPVVPPGQYDSLNVVSWDAIDKKYRVFDRYWSKGAYTGVRAVESRTSDDFLHWSKPTPNEYAEDVPREHFYTSATTRCPGVEDIWLAFPMRFVEQRKKVPSHSEPGVSDSVFMSSRDGVKWDRTFLQAWVRPGNDERNWTERNTMPAWGIVQTPAEPDLFTMYVSEHYRWPTNRLRRVTVRRHGFASVHAGRVDGEFVTKPVTFAGESLALNYATSAVGSVSVEIQDDNGAAIPGFAAADCEAIYGDEMKHAVKWKGGSVAPLAGKTVRLRVLLNDADLYSMQFVKP
jgi:hypothetical protein